MRIFFVVCEWPISLIYSTKNVARKLVTIKSKTRAARKTSEEIDVESVRPGVNIRDGQDLPSSSDEEIKLITEFPQQLSNNISLTINPEPNIESEFIAESENNLAGQDSSISEDEFIGLMFVFNAG